MRDGREFVPRPGAVQFDLWGFEIGEEYREQILALFKLYSPFIIGLY
jgi:hypothetical protein